MDSTRCERFTTVLLLDRGSDTCVRRSDMAMALHHRQWELGAPPERKHYQRTRGVRVNTASYCVGLH